MNQWEFGGPLNTRKIKTLLELKIDRFCGALRTKAEWRHKVGDGAIVAKWKAEAAEQGVSGEEFEFAMKQMRHYASLGGDTTAALSPVLGVFQDDGILTPTLRHGLLEAIRPLENVPAEQKDWHPGSDGQVLDLVHPSLYPLVSMASRRVNPPMPPGVDTWRAYVGGGEVMALRGIEEDGRCSDWPGWKTRFQWLPAEVAVDGAGNATFQSYINNLHPGRHRALYAQLEQLLTAAMPLLATTLTEALAPPQTCITAEMYDLYGSDAEGPSDEDDDDAYEAWWNARRIKNPPKVPETFEPSRAASTVALAGCALQVIVKIASIELTPGHSRYDGGTWHVEGTARERIVATIIAYLDSDNVSESRLAFRTSTDEESISYEQNDENGVRQIYGIEDGDSMNQAAGTVVCAAGRVICFPNTMQHCVRPFALADASRPGHRKIAVFFVVDPTVHVTSTREVPPQQRAWWYEETGFLARLQQVGLPLETRQKIDSYLEFPFTHAQAEAYREELMAERALAKVEDEDEDVYEQHFSLCEH